MIKDKPQRTDPAPIDSKLYDTDYFLKDCEGYREFTAPKRNFYPSKRLQKALEYTDVKSGMRVLDVGCGRGEALVWLAQQGAEVWGVDYAFAALHLSQAATQRMDVRLRSSCHLTAANARCLPFMPKSFDRVLMLDIVEHLYPWELRQAFLEVQRVIKPNGKFIIHTAPNLWYYQIGYPLFRYLEKLRGIQLPKNPRKRFSYHELMHVNEQSIWKLRHTLRQCGFHGRVWLAYFPVNSKLYPKWVVKLANLVQRIPLLQLIFRTHILAVAMKKDAA
jgi:SAM-dependent methyltransferase